MMGPRAVAVFGPPMEDDAEHAGAPSDVQVRSQQQLAEFRSTILGFVAGTPTMTACFAFHPTPWSTEK